MENTIALLSVLSSSTGIPTNELIKYVTCSNNIRATWVSPMFDVKLGIRGYDDR
jgi:hypothetical protein